MPSRSRSNSVVQILSVRLSEALGVGGVICKKHIRRFLYDKNMSLLTQISLCAVHYATAVAHTMTSISAPIERFRQTGRLSSLNTNRHLSLSPLPPDGYSSSGVAAGGGTIALDGGGIVVRVGVSGQLPRRLSSGFLVWYRVQFLVRNLCHTQHSKTS